MKKMYTQRMYVLAVGLLMSLAIMAQQVPNAGFEDWSGAAFDGNIQPANWNASNVTQFGFKFNFAHREAGHTGNYCMMVQDQDIGAAGITETSPGYVSLGMPWVYIESLTKISQATAGDEGGINWTYRPDTMAVWIKRTGNNTDKEDFHLLYYAWTGQSKGDKFKGKNGNCTSVTKYDEESDIRQATNANECGTTTKATQVAEGWLRTRATYSNWTLVKVPIYYMNNSAPQKMNIIFSASNYPNFRANSGLYNGNSLYIDDVQMIYSSKIQHLYIDGKEWLGFDPNSTAEQTYSLGQNATAVPTNIKARRGEGQFTNTKGQTASFPGRELSGSEIQITNGVLDGTPTLITVTAPDGSSTTTYRIKFVRAASTNSYLAGIKVNGQPIQNFNPYNTTYQVALPYGTSTAPIVTVTQQEDQQSVHITQATSVNGTATIVVTAADNKTKTTYSLSFSVAPLADNTLQDITVNGESVAGFMPQQTNYRVSLPLGTTTMPVVQAVSAYPAGEQTITYTAPAEIDGGTYQIAVTTPGNPTPKTYKLNFRLEASSYSKLRDLKIWGQSIEGFDPNQLTYYVTLPIGTQSLPTITYTPGDAYQTVQITPGGLDGTTRVTVTAANGDQTVYKIVFTTLKSEISTLAMIYLNGDSLQGFHPDSTLYRVELPTGTTALPTITYDKDDEFEEVNLVTGSLNGESRIIVTAGDGSVTIYRILFSVHQANDPTLRMIYLDGTQLTGFGANTTEYYVTLPKEAPQPIVTWDTADEWQTVTTRTSANGDYRITVRPQTGNSLTYIIHFQWETSSNTALEMILLNGEPLDDFDADIFFYVDSLAKGVSSLPVVTWVTAEDKQTVKRVRDGYAVLLTVTAEDRVSTQTYTILFIPQPSAGAYLQGISLDGVPMSGFRSEILNYDSLYLTAAGICPAITVEKEAELHVAITAPYAAGTAKILVTGENGQNTYELIFVDTISHSEGGSGSGGGEVIPYIPSTDCTLAAIYMDGGLVPGFTPTTHFYNVPLVAGSEIPMLSYQQHSANQTVMAGKDSREQYRLLVTAENGDTASYVVRFEVAKYDDADLIDLSVAGRSLAFVPTTYSYHLSIDRGLSLPEVSFVTKPGQTTMLATLNDTVQQVIVTAESGRQNTYTLLYTRVESSNALLRAIYLDGQLMEGFDPHVFSYTDSLAWRTAAVKSVHPVGQIATQTITTYHSSVNGVTRIHVQAADGVTDNNYYIAFPVRQSGNLDLEYLLIDHDIVSIDYIPTVTNYSIVLPREDTRVPNILYGKGEPEQQVDIISRPIGDTTQLIVTAENGATRTYNLYFKKSFPTATNILRSLRVKETNEVLDLTTDRSIRNFNVHLPYGCRKMTLEYEKTYDEQTVFVQPGGVNNPTILTVKSNRDGESDEVYTIHPVVDTQNPAVINSISINGQPFAAFDKNRFSYVVTINNATVDETPLVFPVADDDVIVTPTVVNHKHWQAIVTSKTGYTNTYDLWFYYSQDVVPNTEFNSWTTAANNGAPKPTGWNCLADYFTSSDVLGAGVRITSGTHTFGKNGEVAETTVSGANKAVQLNTKQSGGNAISTMYGGALGGYLPAWITLGTIEGTLQEAGGSTFNADGGITFRNTPDVMMVRAKTGSISNQNRIVYRLSGSGQSVLVFSTDANTDYKVYNFNLANANRAVMAPTQLNIILNSYYKESMSTKTQGSDAQLTIDYIRFAYNHTLSGLKVNGNDAEMSGTAFSYDLSDPEQVELPVLQFTGEVADQAQRVNWDATETVSVDYAVRNASVRNFAENGTDYTDYTLKIRRPLDTRSTLSNIYVGGVPLTGFAAGTNDYTYHLAAATRQLPDICPVPSSSRQTVMTAFADSTMTITVTPESGVDNVYTVRFVTDRSSDVTLKALVAGDLVYDPAQTVYNLTADAMPVINFEKQSDLQIVSVHNGVITVTAEDGVSMGTYTINLTKPAIVTSGQLNTLELDGTQPADFAPTTYSYDKPQPTFTSFVRQDAVDSVVLVQTEDYMEWQVRGTEQNNYRISYATTPSANTQLAGIYVGGALLDGFLPGINAYTLQTDTAVALSVLPAEAGQRLIIARSGANYSIRVIAENNDEAEYTLAMAPVRTANALLSELMVDSVMVEGFRPDSFYYHVILPVGAYKEHQPVLPSVSYTAGDDGQQISLETSPLDPLTLTSETYIKVMSGDRTVSKLYRLIMEAEKSHSVELSAIYVNGEPMDRFESGRHYYSMLLETDEVTVGWRSNDAYQTVVDSVSGTNHILLVTAEDGVTKAQYQVDVFVEALSDDATLDMIYLNGEELKNFERAVNSRLDFSPMQNLYTIVLPNTNRSLPEVSARLKMDGQTVVPTTTDSTVLLEVTARDGVTKNTYSLVFLRPLSDNAHLRSILLGGMPFAEYNRDVTYYYRELPVGTTALPDIDVEFEEEEGRQDTAITLSPMDKRATIVVTAEDGVTQMTYTIQFAFLQSNADTLNALYVDTLVGGWNPHVFDYYVPVTNESRTFPEVSYDAVDEWQTITTATKQLSADIRLVTVTVEAQSRLKNTYNVTLEIMRSAVDTAEMIYVNNRTLPGFDPYENEYYYELPAGTTEMPAVTAIKGDFFQKDPVIDTTKLDTLLQKSLGKRCEVLIEAENGQKRTYVIHFPMQLSSDAGLNQIWYDGTPLPNFDEGTSNYRLTLPYGTTRIGLITVTRKEDAQNVDIRVFGDSLCAIHVVAEDGISEMTYEIRFQYALSPNALLSDLAVDGLTISGFRPDSMTYTVLVPSDDELPVLTWQTAEDGQMVGVDTFRVDVEGRPQVTYLLTVTAPDGENVFEYSVTFNYMKRAVTFLSDLLVRGRTIAIEDGFDYDFDSDTMTYSIIYPIGSDSALYFSAEDVTYVLGDEMQTVVITQQDAAVRTIRVTVTAENGQDFRSYAIIQQTLLSSNAAVRMIYLDEKQLPDFRPDVYEYTYYLFEGQTPPEVTFVLEDSLATAYPVTPGIVNEEPWLVIAEAQDGTTSYYAIHFRYSDLNTADQPRAGDVLVQRIPGTTTVAVATLRANVSVGFYTYDGQKYDHSNLDVVDPNNVEIELDGNGQEKLMRVRDVSECYQVTLKPNQLYFYVFFENDKKRISYGKIIIQN